MSGLLRFVGGSYRDVGLSGSAILDSKLKSISVMVLLVDNTSSTI